MPVRTRRNHRDIMHIELTIDPPLQTKNLLLENAIKYLLYLTDQQN